MSDQLELKSGESNKPPRKSSTTALDKTIERLRADIVNGVLVPDAKLRLDDLKARYGVGGSPLREALSRLAGAGFVRAEPQRGFCVPGASREDLLDITMMRQTIESRAIKLAMTRGNEVWEGELIAAFHRLKRRTTRGDHLQTETHARWEEAHKDFHMTLIAACGSPRLCRLQEDLYDQALRYRSMLIEYQFDVDDLVAEHSAVLDAVLSGDQEETIKVLNDHLAITSTIILTDADRPEKILKL